MKRKIFGILLIVFIVIGFSANTVFAAGDDNLSNIITDMKGVGSVTGTSGSQTVKVINTVIRIIQIAGSGISIIVVILVGIKYMLASPADKADYKKTAIPIVIGCVLLFAASNLAGIIENIGTSFNSK